MALQYANLDEATRDFMLREVDFDVERDKLYMSTRLNEGGRLEYESLLREAIANHNDDWLAQQLSARGAFKSHDGLTPTGKPRKVPVNAADTLAEGEFNRFYIRGLSARAVSEGVDSVEVYRGRHSSRPRPESERLIGQRFPAAAVLEDLRNSVGQSPSVGMPNPNTGITVKLP